MTATTTATVSPEEIRALAPLLEYAPAGEVVRWAEDRLGDGLVLTSSFTDSVLIDVVQQVAPQVPVVFLDTGFHFPETLAYVERVARRYDFELQRIGPADPTDDEWSRDPDACCARRKVHPLNEALAARSGWMTGLRRSDSPLRAATPVVQWDARRGLVKVNPIARWTDADVDAYSDERGLLRHPLAEQGFTSIGCWPCTRATRPGEDSRAGRWAGRSKTECGLHQ